MGRSSPEEPPHCPLVGEYTGVIPDAENLCAKSYADCNNPEVMFYTVFNCNNASEIYEEREYRCFGQWKEPETGLVYTYTERRDIKGHECFVGVDIDSDRSIVTEAGANCERGHQPRKYGMTLERQSKCPAKEVPRWNSDFAPSKHRPISPRVGNVHRVNLRLPEQDLSSDSDRESDSLSELEERYYEREIMGKTFGGSDNDLITNEISDSYRGSSSGSLQSTPASSACVIIGVITVAFASLIAPACQ